MYTSCRKCTRKTANRIPCGRRFETAQTVFTNIYSKFASDTSKSMQSLRHPRAQSHFHQSHVRSHDSVGRVCDLSSHDTMRRLVYRLSDAAPVDRHRESNRYHYRSMVHRCVFALPDRKTMQNFHNFICKFSGNSRIMQLFTQHSLRRETHRPSHRALASAVIVHISASM